MKARKYKGETVVSKQAFPLLTWLVKFKKQVVVACAAMFVLFTSVALYQPVYPVAGKQLSGWDYFLYPKETNPQLRLAGIGAELTGLATAGRNIWVIGEQGTIVHSADAGNCWRPQGPWRAQGILNAQGTLKSQESADNAVEISDTDSSATAVTECLQEQTGSERLFSILPSFASNFPTNMTLFPKANASTSRPSNDQQQSDKDNYQQKRQQSLSRSAPAKTNYSNESIEQSKARNEPNKTPTQSAPISSYRNNYVEGLDVAENFVPNLASIAFANEQQGVIVGEKGTILLTSDGGKNWTKAKQYSEFDLNSVAFQFNASTQESTIIAVGEGGIILISKNLGESWRTYKTSASQDLLSVSINARDSMLITSKNELVYYSQGPELYWRATTYNNVAGLKVALVTEGDQMYIGGPDGRFTPLDEINNQYANNQYSNIQQQSPQPTPQQQEFYSQILSLDSNNQAIVGITQDNQLLIANNENAWLTYQPKSNQEFVAVKLLNQTEVILVSRKGIVTRFNRNDETWQQLTTNIMADQNNRSLHYSVGVAPWWYFASLFCAGLILLTIWPRDEGANPEEGIAGMAASDKPLQPGDPDALNLGKIAADVTSFLSNPKTTAPLTLAITGPWGCGKSSLMNLIRADLKERGFLPVWFNAWHHQKGEQLLASLFAHITQQAIPPWFSFDGVIFRARLIAIRGRRHWFIFALMMFLLFMTWAINDGNTALVNKLQTMNWSEFWTGLFGTNSVTTQTNHASSGVGVVPMLASLLGIAAPLIAFFKSVKGFGISPEKLVSVDHRNKDQKGYDPGARARFAEEFADVTTALGSNKMVIFIDDLDRCSQENLIDILENINFISSSGDCYLLLGMAPKYIEACVANAYETLAQNIAEKERYEESRLLEREQIASVSNKEKHKFAFAHQYLEKMINIEIAIPSMSENSIERLLHQSEQTDNENNDTPTYQRLLSAIKPLFGQLHRAMPLIFIVVAIKAGWDYGKSVPEKPKPKPPSVVSLGTIDAESLANLISSHPELAINPDGIPKKEFKIALEADHRIASKGLKVASIGSGNDKLNLILSMTEDKQNQSSNQSRETKASRSVNERTNSAGSQDRDSSSSTNSAMPTIDSRQAEDTRANDNADRSYQAIIPFRAEKRDTSPRLSGSVLLLFILLFSSFSLYIFKRQKQKFSKDSDDFREALNRWTHWIQVKQETPRAIKRFLNHLRYQSIRNRKVISESLLVAYASIAFFEKSWILNERKFNMICDGHLSELLANEFQSSRDKKGTSKQWEKLAEGMNKSLTDVDKQALKENRQHALNILQSSSLDDVPISI